MTFGYGYGLPEHHEPNPTNPVVYQMWRRMGPEPTFGCDQKKRIPYDGRPVYIDLFKCEMSEEPLPEADLKVTLTRTPQQIKWGDRGYDWKAVIEALRGGIQRGADPFMYLAPEAGYGPRIELGYAPGAPNWTEQDSVRLFILTRGKYGRVSLGFFTASDKPKTSFDYSSCVNPAGSRNLEPE